MRPAPRASPAIGALQRQAVGPAASVTVAVCVWPEASVQPMLILSPGW